MRISRILYSSGRQPFFMRAQILSIKIIEGPAVLLKHTVAVAYAESFRDFVSDFATFSQNNGDL